VKGVEKEKLGKNTLFFQLWWERGKRRVDQLNEKKIIFRARSHGKKTSHLHIQKTRGRILVADERGKKSSKKSGLAFKRTKKKDNLLRDREKRQDFVVLLSKSEISHAKDTKKKRVFQRGKSGNRESMIKVGKLRGKCRTFSGHLTPASRRPLRGQKPSPIHGKEGGELRDRNPPVRSVSPWGGGNLLF